MSTRSIKRRVAGHSHGFIHRLVGPSDLAEVLKPFVLLDHVEGDVKPGTGFGMHPHSGIATLTYHLDADVAYEDTTGQHGTVEATGLEWMRAGGGTWHQGFIHPHGTKTTGFQLWIALPPGVEDGAVEGIYLSPERVPQVANVRVLLGEYEGAKNPISVPSPITYLDVSLGSGEAWTFSPPIDQRVGWIYVYRGSVRIGSEAVSNELVVFDESDEPVEVSAVEDARFLVGSAKKHDHPLVLGTSSVHTNPQSLARGLERIREIGRELREAGRL
jgi:redox-sensitive bicupin YhaK (pirin superfamily)